MQQKQIVKVAVADTNYGFDRAFDYALPGWEADAGANYSIKVAPVPGCRVLVPFGNGNRKRIALILSYGDYDKNVIYKEISGVIDDVPAISAEGLMLINRLKETTFCTYFDACKLFLPASFNVKLKTRYKVNAERFEALHSLMSDDDIKAVLQVEKTGNYSGDNLKYLLSENIIYPEEYITKKEKTEKIVRLTDEYREGRLKYAFTNDKTRKTVEHLGNSPDITDKELINLFGITSASLRTLQKRGVIDMLTAAKGLLVAGSVTGSVAGAVSNFDNPLRLSEEQRTAADGILSLIRNGKPSASLLFGVTGSGKTAVFTELIVKVLSSGKTAILLVPEIALTPQLIKRFTEIFGNAVSCLHSGLSVSRRGEEYARIRAGHCKLLIGTRSAVFAPIENIGLIIIDEEQERTFVSEMSPRYDAKEIAKMRCVYHNAALVLASATPSVESYHFAKIGRYNLFTLKKRFAEAVLPEVNIVDVAADGYYNDSQNLSCTLVSEINDNLARKEQTILLLNRRGFNTIITCRSCKQTIMCPNCSVALTYHKSAGKLRCHWCGYVREEATVCPSCGSEYLNFIGTGTEKIESEIAELFPSARVLRLDADTIGSRGNYEELFKAYSRGDYDILLGTQMVAKGLDFPNVTLVGVISVDSALYAGDYRSYERTFSLLTQVAGRGGRGGKPGRAVIQTFNPHHYILKLAASQNFPDFFGEEIGNRKLLLYPPFCDLYVVEFTGSDDGKTAAAAAAFASLIRAAVNDKIKLTKEKIPLILLGPSKCIRERINNKFRYKLIIKCKSNGAFRSLLSDTYKKTFTERVFDRITVSIASNGDASM
ncbi:MAG: primosomal protein N' [Ruminococcus sp.]|jgi:primosomal protein N' (replication factor Y)|nr:primosomal protein N' [Ruminococcus sp.]